MSLKLFSDLVKPLIYLSSLHLFYLAHPDLSFLNVGIVTLLLFLEWGQGVFHSSKYSTGGKEYCQK